MFQTADAPFRSLFEHQMPDIRKRIRAHFGDTKIHILLLRFGIGFAWLMTGIGKVTNPIWHQGDALVAFLNNQLMTNAVYFGAYESFIVNTILPNAAEITWAMLAIEILVGLAILFGTYTKPALSVGMLMNVNLIALGVANPSILYILVQAILFSSESKSVQNVRTFLANRNPGVFYFVMPKEQPKRLMRTANSRGVNSTDGSKIRSTVKVGKDVVMGGRMKDSYMRVIKNGG